MVSDVARSRDRTAKKLANHPAVSSFLSRSRFHHREQCCVLSIEQNSRSLMQQMLRNRTGACMNRIKRLTFLVLAAILPAAHRLSAQQQVFDATVPFQFSAGDRTFPAGEYRIVRHDAFLDIENRKDYSATLILTSSTDSSSDGKAHLVFDHINDTFFLRKVVARANSIQLAATRTEKKAIKDQRHLAAANPPAVTVLSAVSAGR
jgi:hypothetical protein